MIVRATAVKGRRSRINSFVDLEIYGFGVYFRPNNKMLDFAALLLRLTYARGLIHRIGRGVPIGRRMFNVLT